MDEGFALKPCNVIDISHAGVRISIDAAETVAGTFRFLKSRDAGAGRRARVKWRRGSEIGAEFV